MRIAKRIVLTVALATLTGVSAMAEDDETPARRSGEELDAYRAEFIENFDWIQLNSTPGDAMMLRILVESSNAQRGVEIGSATGYGAIVMGIGFERNGGKLTTVDIDPDMVAKSRENLAAVQLEETVDVVEGDALEVLPEIEGEIDFVYIDALKKDYMKYFKALEDNLVPGAVVVADNVIRSAGAMQDFLEYIAESDDYLSVTIRASDMKNDGMLVIHKLR
jgi:caffeoyl-CoA O-methyltransferase